MEEEEEEERVPLTKRRRRGGRDEAVEGMATTQLLSLCV